MKNPPPAVKLVMAAVCVMKGVKPEKITDSEGKKVIHHDDYIDFGQWSFALRPKLVTIANYYHMVLDETIFDFARLWISGDQVRNS